MSATTSPRRLVSQGAGSFRRRRPVSGLRHGDGAVGRRLGGARAPACGRRGCGSPAGSVSLCPGAVVAVGRRRSGGASHVACRSAPVRPQAAVGGRAGAACTLVGGIDGFVGQPYHPRGHQADSGASCSSVSGDPSPRVTSLLAVGDDGRTVRQSAAGTSNDLLVACSEARARSTCAMLGSSTSYRPSASGPPVPATTVGRTTEE